MGVLDRAFGCTVSIVPLLGMAIGLGSPLGIPTAWADGLEKGPVQPFSDLPIVAPRFPILPEWQAPDGIGDYREHIEKMPFGYLRWQRFPVRVVIEPVVESPGSAAAERDQRWVAAVRGAIADWLPYVPLVEVTVESSSGQRNRRDLDLRNLNERNSLNQSNNLNTLDNLKERNIEGEWDIYVSRSRPPLQRLPDGTILPARIADTRYEMLSPMPGNPIQFRFRIRMGNQQGEAGLRATARHELGHALGLWGHSTNPQDVMYPAQMGNYPPISDRDLKTLQWLYSTP